MSMDFLVVSLSDEVKRLVVFTILNFGFFGLFFCLEGLVGGSFFCSAWVLVFWCYFVGFFGVGVVVVVGDSVFI